MPHRIRLISLCIAAIFIACGGAYLAYADCNAERFAQAGAVVVAVAFFAMFVARDTPRATLADLPPPPPGQRPSAEDLEKRQEGIFRIITVQLEVAGREKLYLALLSVSGTLIWAFGEELAGRWLLPLSAACG